MHRLQFYGKLKAMCSEAGELAPQKSVAELQTALIQKYPNLAGEPFFISTKERILQIQDLLEGNEIISIMPPFSGG
jgi:molybdopterin converting factor small subunit